MSYYKYLFLQKYPFNVILVSKLISLSARVYQCSYRSSWRPNWQLVLGALLPGTWHTGDLNTFRWGSRLLGYFTVSSLNILIQAKISHLNMYGCCLCISSPIEQCCVNVVNLRRAFFKISFILIQICFKSS